MACQSCQRNVPTARVSLAQNIGMVVARQSKNFTADLCRECGMRMVKSMTLITFFFGWWGVISLIVTPVFLIINGVAWANLRKLPHTDAWVGAGTIDPSTFGAPPAQGLSPPSGTLDPSQFGAPSAAPPPYTGNFGQGAYAQNAAGPKGRVESAANWALGLSVAGIVLFCVPFVSLGGLYMAYRARTAAREEGRDAPKSVMVALILGVVSLLMFAGTVAIGVFADHEKSQKVAALRALTGKSRAASTLDKETACALVEEQLLEGLYQHKQEHKKLACAGVLEDHGDAVELKNVVVDWEDTSKTFTACLRRDERWFVASLSPCAQAPLPAKTPGLDIEAQEQTWRDAEGKALAAERKASFKNNLALIHRGTTEDVDACSSKIAKQLWGEKDPEVFTSGLPTVDDEVLAEKFPKGWAFLNSSNVTDALDDTSGDQTSAMTTLFDDRFIVVVRGMIARELPVVPSTKAGMAYDGGSFLGMMYVADVSTGRIACVAPLAVENSDTVSVMEYRGSKASDATVRTGVMADFRKQYADAVRHTLTNVFNDKPAMPNSGTADEDADEPEDPDQAPPPPPPVKQAKGAKKTP